MDTKYFELHVTVAPDNVLAFADFCRRPEITAKPLYIQLSQGRHQYQPMLAQTHMLLSDHDAEKWAIDYAEIVAAHFPVTRVKLESRLTEGSNKYYEAHWKLRLDREQDYWLCKVQDFCFERHSD